ncbi:hypothetical protein ZWY2020_060021 [Hordeum vulgare]|nr:hypothetical protein ZWY2020_060021 [Hordeum vulgare]
MEAGHAAQEAETSANLDELEEDEEEQEPSYADISDDDSKCKEATPADPDGWQRPATASAAAGSASRAQVNKAAVAVPMPPLPRRVVGPPGEFREAERGQV